MQNLKFASRGLMKSPGFTAVAIVTLALGIGANSAIFTVVNAVIMRPLPFPDANRLVRLTSDFTANGMPDVGVSTPELVDYRDRSGLFEVALVLRQALILAAFGVVCGGVAAVIVSKLMAKMLFQVEPTDPWRYTAIAVLLSLTAALAAWRPARTASTVDPIIALRVE